jgi:hypothetical protein
MLDVGKLAVVLSADIGPGKCRRKADMTPTQADMMPTECRHVGMVPQRRACPRFRCADFS